MNKIQISLLFGIPLIGILIFPALFGQQQTSAQEKRRICVAKNGPLPEIKGSITMARGAYYLLEGGKWHYLLPRCDPADSKHGCTEASPAQKALEQHISEPIRARICDFNIAQFEIEGQWFDR